VQAREGLNIGLAVLVRYRLEPKRLDSIHTHLRNRWRTGGGSGGATIYRQLAPNFITREIFATRAKSCAVKAAELITSRLQATDRSAGSTAPQTCNCPRNTPRAGRTLAEGAGERAARNRNRRSSKKQCGSPNWRRGSKGGDVKATEAQAQVRVLQAKAEADAMQYTLR